jgi:hypothetical protein
MLTPIQRELIARSAAEINAGIDPPMWASIAAGLIMGSGVVTLIYVWASILVLVMR